ncbi:hypothetical protein [uncultured Clostridium sp.]|uniref:hypothetical protein n=1 Tax=uncultured Clostridium sp. TaxID=59620 RepID=UPI0026051F20|nr:hypothetical protein [uncultured Clostridium sp.]
MLKKIINKIRKNRINNNKFKKISVEVALNIMETREPRGLFWTKEKDIYIGIDNTSGDFWCADFYKKKECFQWLRREDFHE